MGDLLKFSLQDHLTECEERYQDVLNKLDSVDQRLGNIERLVEELKVLVVKR